MINKSLKNKEQEIRDWFSNKADPENFTHRQAILRAARMLYSRQTIAEQHGQHTNELNNVGFNQYDAGFGSRLARWSKPDIDSKTAKSAISMLKKYAKQLAEITTEKSSYLNPSEPSC